MSVLIVLSMALSAPALVWAQEDYDSDEEELDESDESDDQVPASPPPWTRKAPSRQAEREDRREEPEAAASQSSSPDAGKRARANPEASSRRVVGREARFDAFSCPGNDPLYRDYYVICVDAYEDRIEHTAMFRDQGRMVSPNRPYVIIALHHPNQRIEVASIGTTGIYKPGIAGVAELLGEAEAQGFGFGGDDVAWQKTVLTLPAQLPGKGGVAIRLVASGSQRAVHEVNVDFAVQTTYAGAIRLGVATLFGGAIDGAYAVRQQPGSQQAEVVAQVPDPFNLELTLGYAAFLDRHGRPDTGCASSPWCFAPYIGVGVLAQGPEDNLKFLNALHVGVEWEPVHNFSIGFTLVGRRVSRLGAGYVVGGPADPRADLTTNRYAAGFGVVFNVSPSFFKIAAQGASKTLGN